MSTKIYLRVLARRLISFLPRRRDRNLSDSELYALRFRLKDIIQERQYNKLLASAGSTVRHGPFAGMTYQVSSTWGDPVMKLLGLYEACLHKSIEYIIQNCQGYNIVDLGCAEGYYAAGLAKALRSTTVIFSDISKNAISQCESLILANRPEANVFAYGQVSKDWLLVSLEMFPKSIVICDIEGAEHELFADDDILEACRSCFLIIEIHEFLSSGVGSFLANKFASSHQVVHVTEYDQNPSSMHELSSLPGLDRALSCCESRPELMTWIFLIPFAKSRL